jgi:multiple sugar transport system permease protein
MPRAQSRSRGNYAGRRRRAGLWLVMPALLLLIALLAYPIAASVVLSFTNASTRSGSFGGEFVGFANYLAMPDDEVFGIALRNSVYFTLVEVVAVLLVGLGTALLLNHSLGRLGVYRVVLLIPWALAPVANAVLWRWIYNSSYGILNALLMQFGLVDMPVVWLGDPFLALNALLVADVWKAVPFISLLLLAGLQNIPPHLYRAARLDGAGTWQRFRFITLPQLRTPILVCIVLQSIWALKVFDLIYVLTKGGPADATMLLNFLAYRVTFGFGDYGYGAALANVLFAAMLVLSVLYVRALRSKGQPRRAA